MIESTEKIRLMIGVPILGSYVNTSFFVSFNELVKPQEHIVCTINGSLVDIARNEIAKQAILTGSTHLLFVDSDMTFPRHMITKLLSHDKDIVTGFFMSRRKPYVPTLYKNKKPITKEECKGLIEIEHCGFAAVLIKVDVFKKLKYPYFRFDIDEKGMFGEDFYFCNKAREAGYKIYTDTTIDCGHLVMRQVKKKDWVEEIDRR